MQHPRRNEVFRDVGSRRRDASDEDFIEMKEFLFRPDAAFLLCSDGLSDLVTADEIREIVERYDGDPEKVSRDLVDAANQAGGKDNITAVFVAGNEFVGSSSPAMVEARARHSITRARTSVESAVTVESGVKPKPVARLGRALISRVAFLVYGFLIGVLVALTVR